MELTPGSLLHDRYLIKEQLGKGGMGTVYLAEDQALDHLVAVKSNLSQTPESQRQFEREARMLAALRHPNLPLVSDHFILDDVQYLVMDFISGDNLSTRLKDEGPQSVARVLDWAEQVADALTYLHSQNPPVIHRDIKPANLKLTPEGKVILVDFGIAKATAGDTTVGARGYSPGYAPPEQYSNATTGPYSDQYSLAATLYALLTGGPPPESIDIMLGNDRLAPTRTFSTLIPPHVDAAIQKAMSVEPDKRFGSVAAFVHALKEPAAMAEETQRPQVEKKPRRTGLFIAGGLFVLVVIVGVGLAGFNLLKNGLGAARIEASATQVVAAHPSETALPLAAADTPTATLTPTITLTPTPEDTPTPSPSPTATFTATPQPTPLGGAGKIVFVSDRDGSGYDQIFTMDSNGANITQLTFDKGDKSNPMWSPDGQRIAYAADGGRSPNNQAYGLDIWVMNADGSEPVNLTQSPKDDADPVWTPDGKRIVFASWRNGKDPMLFIMNSVHGTNVQMISDEFSEYNPTFSPDGTVLAFSSTYWYTLNIRTGNRYQDLALYDDEFRLGKLIQPDWSPDGKYIAYVRTTGNNRDIYIVEYDSGGATTLRLTEVGLNYDPAWSPDSLWIVFSTSRDGNDEIYVMDFGGRFVQNLTNNPASDKQPDWQPLP